MNTPFANRRAALVLIAASLPTVAAAAPAPYVYPEIISAWKANTGTSLLMFRYDGTYYHVLNSATDPGVERGTYAWDKTTGSFSATARVDTNGTAGLSPLAGNPATTVTIASNTLTRTVSGQGTTTYSRVLNTGPAIVGSWFIPGKRITLTFLSDNHYYFTSEGDEAPESFTGMEYGTYTWTAATGAVSFLEETKSLGDAGIGHESGLTAVVTGNKMAFTDPDSNGGQPFPFERINSTATPIRLPDFQVVKTTNYSQVSASPPVLFALPADYPYFTEANIESTISATAPTLKIGTRTPRAFSFDEEDNSFYIEDEYTTKGAMDAATAYPDNTNYLFASGANGTGGTATLSFPAAGVYPATANFLPVENADGWSAETYFYPREAALKWTLNAAYNPARVSVIEVEDFNTGEDIIDEQPIEGDMTSLDLADRLEPGHKYLMTIDHVSFASSTTTGTGVFAGKQGHSFYVSSTEAIFQTQEEESPHAPVFTYRPIDRIVLAGSDVSLSVAASGYPRPTYQWYKNNVALPGQTGNSLALFNYDAADDGTYKVTATNIIKDGGGNPVTHTITSPNAVLTRGNAYQAFVSGYGLNPATTGAEQNDFDKDGLPNLVELLVGGNPTDADPELIPTLTKSPIAGGQNLVFKYYRSTLSTGIVTGIVQHNTTLEPAWVTAVNGVGGVTITSAPSDDDEELVTVTIPSTTTKRFVRLNASR